MAACFAKVKAGGKQREVLAFEAIQLNSFLVLIVSIVPGPLSAKWNTVKITIKGASLTTLLEITDRALSNQRLRLPNE